MTDTVAPGMRYPREIAEANRAGDDEECTIEFLERRQDLRFLPRELYHARASLTRHDTLVLKVPQTSMSYFTVLASFQ